MRVTNMMLTNNSLIHMGKSKERFMDAMEKYTTEKKIQRPSDDPVIAVRALKYRSNLYELEQYLERNIPDAISWMDVTEEAMSQISSRITQMRERCDQGANGTWSLEDLNGMVEELQQYKAFIYEQQLNTDFAGRYVFTGYRTNTPMLFQEPSNNLQYEITETHKPTDILGFTFSYGGPEYVAGNTDADYAAEAADLVNGHKMMLAYSDLDDTGSDYVTITYTDAGGTTQTVPATTVSANAGPNLNEAYRVTNPGGAHFIPETGELVFGDDLYEELVRSSGFEVTYQKTNFDKNDIRPEHYFDCMVTDLAATPPQPPVSYQNPEGQNIRYEINFSQTLTVNTLGCNVIGPEIGRMVDDIENAVYSLRQSADRLKDAEQRLADTDKNDKTAVEALNKLIEMINDEISLKEKVVHDAFSRALTQTLDSEQKVNVAMANHGARYVRLEMTESKLEDQRVQFEEIMSENEDIDLGEALIKYNQADMLYQASLSATSKLLGNSLLNFI